MARKKSEGSVVESAQEVILELPIGDPPASGYEGKQVLSGRVGLAPKNARLHVQAQLGHEAAVTFIRIRNGLRGKNARLSDGRPVWTNVDALRWIMEQAAEQLQSSVPSVPSEEVIKPSRSPLSARL